MACIVRTMKEHHVFVDSRSRVNNTRAFNNEFNFRLQTPLHRAIRVQMRDITVAYPRMYLYVEIEEFSAVLPVFVAKGYDACTHCPKELTKTIHNGYIPVLHSLHIRLLDEHKMVLYDDLTEIFAVTIHLIITCLDEDEEPEPHQKMLEQYVVLDSRVSRLIASKYGGIVDTFVADIMDGRKIEVDALQIRSMTVDREMCDEAYVLLDIPAFALSLSDDQEVPIAYTSESFGNYLTLETMYIMPEIHTKVYYPRKLMNQVRIRIISPTTGLPVLLDPQYWVAIMLYVRYCEVPGALPAAPAVPVQRCDVVQPPPSLPVCAYFEQKQYIVIDNRKRTSGSDYAFSYTLPKCIKRVCKIRLMQLVMNLAVGMDGSGNILDWDLYTTMNIKNLGISWRVPYSSWSLPNQPNVLQTHESVHSVIMDPSVSLYKLDIDFQSKLYNGLYQYNYSIGDPTVLIILEVTQEKQMIG